MYFRLKLVAKKSNFLLSLSFFFLHTCFAILLGRFYALAPDEPGYLFAFKNIYNSAIENPQYNSGWITSPSIFLKIVYLPAKLINFMGVPDILSVRILSILISTVSLYLILDLANGSKSLKRSFLIFSAYFIPSIFLWTSIGLREAFIMAELTLFFVGFSKLLEGKNLSSYVLLSIGSYSLLSTKYYLWAILFIAFCGTLLIMVFRISNKVLILRAAFFGLMLPLGIFLLTVSSYSLSFMTNADIKATNMRSGDSVIQIAVDNSGNSLSNPNESPDPNILDSNGNTSLSNGKQIITFHGDMTLVLLRSYLQENRNSTLSKILGFFQVDRKIEDIWDEKIRLGLVSKSRKAGNDTSSLNGHILVPGNFHNPLSFVVPALVFLCGPFPFVGNPGMAVGIASLESPLWWALYALVIFSFIRARKWILKGDYAYWFVLIFMLGEVAMSSLVEVNLGTAFRHRSIIFIPLLFLYSIASRNRNSDQILASP